MATYIPGIQDYIPQIQPFSPDYNYLGNVLQTRQGKYDSAQRQLSSVYGTLLNSPMLRDENVKKREEFFRDVDTSIKKISGMDLSMQQNVNAAMKVFKPFYEDKDMVKDMTWTRNWQNQLQRGENFRTCVDPEKCGGQYWEGGIKALQYKADEFKKLSSSDALNFASPSYVPSVNVMAKAIKDAKDAGFKVKYDEVKGGYIVTTSNGDKMIAPLTSYFMSRFGSDPKVMEYYKTQAYIQRKEFAYNNASLLGGEDQANTEYIRRLYQSSSDAIGRGKQKADSDHDSVSVFKDAYSRKVQTEGVLPDDKRTIDDWNTINEQFVVTSQTRDVYKKASDLAENTRMNSDNIHLMSDKIDELLGFSMLSRELGNAATAYADLTTERSIKADPYSLASFESSLSFQNQVRLKGMDFDIWKQKEAFKAEQEKKKWDDILGNGVFNGAQAGSKGQATNITNPSMALETNTRKEMSIVSGITDNTNNFLKSMVNSMQTQYLSSVDQDVLLHTSKQIFAGTGIDGAKVIQGDINELNKLDRLGYNQASKLYEKAIQIIDPKASITGPVNSSWSKDFWSKTMDQRRNIKNQIEIKQEYDKHFEQESLKNTSAVMGRLMVEDKASGTKKASLVKVMTDMNSSGFLPPVLSDPSSVESVASRYAELHQSEFKPSTPTQRSVGPATTYASVPGALVSNSVSGYEAAYNFAKSNVKDLANTWLDSYKDNAQAFNHAEGFGKSSNATMGGGYTYRMDSGVPTHNNTIRFAELVKNYQNIGADAIVKFGDAGSITEDSPEARKIADQYINDFFSSGNLKNSSRPRGNYSVQRIGGYNENYMAFTFYPDESWAGQSKLRGTKTSPGITSNKGYQSGITVFIPANKANNSFFNDTQFTDEDFLLNKRGKITIDDFPDAGRVSVQKSGNQYLISGQLISVDAQGNKVITPVETTTNADLSASILVDTWSKELNTLQTWNQNQLEIVRRKKGIKDPNAILK